MFVDTGFKGGSRLACKHRVDRYEGLILSTVNVFLCNIAAVLNFMVGDLDEFRSWNFMILHSA